MQGFVAVAAAKVFFVKTATPLRRPCQDIQKAGAYTVVASDDGQTTTLAGAFTAIPPCSQPECGRGEPERSLGYPVGECRHDLCELHRIRHHVTHRRRSFSSGRIRASHCPGEATIHAARGSILLAINQQGSAGIIPAGSTETIPVDVFGTASDNIQVAVADPSAVIDWSSLQSQLEPSGLSASAWNEVYADFTSIVGNTIGQLQTVLDNAASYLSTIGRSSPILAAASRS